MSPTDKRVITAACAGGCPAPKYTEETCGGDTPATIPNNSYGYGIIDLYQSFKQAEKL